MKTAIEDELAMDRPTEAEPSPEGDPSLGNVPASEVAETALAPEESSDSPVADESSGKLQKLCSLFFDRLAAALGQNDLENRSEDQELLKLTREYLLLLVTRISSASTSAKPDKSPGSSCPGHNGAADQPTVESDD